MRRLTVVLGLVAVLCGLAATPALAEPPSALSGRVADAAGVLSTSDEQRVQSAFEQAQQRAGVRLSVAYVKTFDGLSGSAWAEQAGAASGLGADDVLLAVAVQDRQYDVHRGSGVPASRLQSAKSDVQKALGDGDWAGAAVALADDVAGTSTSSSSSRGGGGGLATLVTVVLLLVLAGGGYLFFRSRRRRRELERQEATALPGGERPPADPYEGTPTDQLNGRASTALLDLDEKVRTAQVDLDVARAYFGEDALPGYAPAVQDAQADLARAFQLRQELDDDIPEDEPTTRRMLAELLQRTGHADSVLSAQAAAVDELRERERDVPRALEELQGKVDQLQQRLPQEQQRLAGLAQRYAPSALSAVADNVDQAGVRLSAAEQALQRARDDAAAGNTGRAVGTLRPADEAVAQSATLLDAVERLAGDLSSAEQRLAGARAEVEADLAEARSLARGGDGRGLPAQIARTEAALAGVDAAVRPSGDALPDPLGALRRLEEAAGGLRQALGTARDAATQARKAAQALDQALLSARSSVGAAGDFISTRRGAVGSEARTRLAEAQRHLDTATGQASRDPVAALGEAQRADQLAQYALQVAQDDVQQWSQQTGYGWGGGGYGGGYGGGWGGGGYGPGWGGGYGRRGGSGLGWGLGGLLLGGLLFGDHDGDGGAGYGGGWGDGGSWDGGGDFGGGWDGGGDFGGGFGGGDSGGSF